MVNVNCTGGGGYFSEDVSALKAHVINGYYTVTNDSGDEIVEGAMADVGASDVQKVNSVANNNLYLGMTNGAHRTNNQTQGYPEVYIPLSTLRTTIGATDASKILNGTTIAGLAGTMVNRETWNGTIGLSGSVTIPAGYHNGQGKITRAYSTYAGGTFTPKSTDQTIPTQGKIVTGNIICAGDQKLIAQNIKHGVNIGGVTGTYLSPIVYNGGDGTALFGSKSFTYDYWYREPYYHYHNDTYSSFNASTMTTSMGYRGGNGTVNGGGYIVANKKFDISVFNTMTVVISHDQQNVGCRSFIGLSTQCEMYGAYQSNSLGLDGEHYYSANMYMENPGDYTITLDLTKAKADGSSYYPYIYVTSYKTTGVGIIGNQVIKSIIFS